jgi:hypothetical protein
MFDAAVVLGSRRAAIPNHRAKPLASGDLRI